jgi:hypothetical protein
MVGRRTVPSKTNRRIATIMVNKALNLPPQVCRTWPSTTLDHLMDNEIFSDILLIDQLVNNFVSFSLQLLVSEVHR